MKKKTLYKCSVCDHETECESGQDVPEHCGKPMVKVLLETCIRPAHDMAAHPMDEEEPCDDARSGE